MLETIDEIPYEQLHQMKNKVINHLYEINEDKLRIACTSKDSFIKLVAHVFQENAAVNGYKIAFPFARVTKIFDNVWDDISDGL